MLNKESIVQAVTFGRGLRGFLRDPVEIEQATRSLSEAWSVREERFVDGMERLVWSNPASPYLGLLAHAGVERGDIESLVARAGLPGALASLRDAGVHVTYEEYLGDQPAERGSSTFSFSPEQFLNPAVRADYMGSTSGTRSGGTPVGKSFGHLRTMAMADLLHRRIWGADGAPSAVWFPVLPSSAGLNNVLRLTITGDVPERWFSHVDPAEREIGEAKRAANRLLPGLSRLLGSPVPRPEHVPAGPPMPVLDWCADALDREGRAFLVTYPTSAVALARAAQHRGVRLDGLVLRLGGEPATTAKVHAIEAAGATPANCYAFAQVGRVAMACPASPTEELHVLEHEVEVIDRHRDRGDGATVDAYLWTTLDAAAPSVLLNVENDDYGSLRRQRESCGCALGEMGMRTFVGQIRGMSKVVTGGITLGPDVLLHLAEVVLPERFGGGPGDYQFSEAEHDGSTRLLVRVSPAVGDVDERAVVHVLSETLRASDLGVLARHVWSGTDTVVVVREAPVVTRSGKQLVFEPIRS